MALRPNRDGGDEEKKKSNESWRSGQTEMEEMRIRKNQMSHGAQARLRERCCGEKKSNESWRSGLTEMGVLRRKNQVSNGAQARLRERCCRE